MSEFEMGWHFSEGDFSLALVVSGLDCEDYNAKIVGASVSFAKDGSRLKVLPTDEKDAEFNRFYDLNEAKAAALERFRQRLVAFLKETGGVPVDPDILQRMQAMEIGLRNLEAALQPRDFAAEMIAEHCPKPVEGKTFLNTPKVGDIRYVSSDEPLPEGWDYGLSAVVDTNPPLVPIRYVGV